MKRRTKQREAILRVVKGTPIHPSADWVYEQVRRRIPNISLGTVYRNLRWLQEEGELRELKFNGSAGRYDAVTENHPHFICKQCGRVFDLDNSVNGGLDTKVAQRTGFKVSDYKLELMGLCNDCQSESVDTMEESRKVIGSR